MTYTTEEIKAELQKFKLPWIAKVWKKIGVPFIRYSFLPAFVLIAVLGIIYNESSYGRNDWMWAVDKGIVLFYIFGVGTLALAGHFAERIAVNKLRKKLGLSHQDFKILVESYGITGM